ncbi:geranylgeranyl pyrophosphate synthase [Amnibacterium flavum]|uniref:Geranylgeranyl pyrophosphate synthase n=1 Tax=Amnibacterium flavum TaxID=2173173 RepID=A0A2V1HY22_9MICO|nr:geranylgeranyl pyrophosphate synthase [Amnibacterium flavum]
MDAVLREYFSLASARARSIDDRYERLWGRLESSASGGKRFRPLLVLAAYEGLGGTDETQAARVGAAFELLHTALIVHDDVIDRDFTRRGLPNVSGSYRDIATTAGIPIPAAEHRGMSAAVIAGDLALAGVYRLVESARLDDVVREKVLQLVDWALFASAAGELADVDFSMSASVPSIAKVLDMARLKTAVYTFEAPLQAGAVLAGADERTGDLLGEFGREIGIAYQATDDLLGLFGDEARTGKSTLGDLREGKSTLPVAHAATTPLWPEIARYFGRSDLTTEDADEARRLLIACGAESATRALASRHAAAAIAVLEQLPAAVGERLRPIAVRALERDK